MRTDHLGTNGNARVIVIVIENTPELERLAAERLCAYLEKLLGST